MANANGWTPARRRLDALPGLVADAGRILAGLVVWNWRKHRFRGRIRGGGLGGRCPCQSPSDSGRGGETRCEAALTFARPGRFRAICPRLQPTADGWRCSVDTVHVRPFWRRAAALYGALVLGGYLALTAGLFTAARVLGYRELNYIDLAWPGRWDELRPIQASHFQRQAQAAFQRGNYPTALLALSTAFVRDPSRLETGLLLAQLREQLGQWAASDQLFTDLLARFPAERHRIAVHHHDALLASGRLGTLADFALAELAIQPDPAWVRALVFALWQGSPRSDFWTRRETAIAKLAAGPRALVTAVRDLRDGLATSTIARLQALPPADPVEARLRCEMLAAAGDRLAAFEAIERDRPLLGDFHAALLIRGLRDGASATPPLANAGPLFAAGLNSARIDALCARLVTVHDSDLLHAVARATPVDALAPDALAALWLAARAHDESVLAKTLEAQLLARLGRPLPEPPPPANRAALQAFLATLPLPRETIYALVARSRQ